MILETARATAADALAADMAGRRRCRIGLGVTAACLLLCLARYLATAVAAIRFPFGIDYGEGIVWQQMLMIIDGHGYGSIRSFPAIVFHYPPIYHLVTAAGAGLFGADPLATGRLVSVSCALATAGIIGGIVPMLARSHSERATYRICAAFAAVMAICTQPIMIWSILMRVDLVCVVATFGGLYFGLRAIRAPRMIYPAAVLFVIAIFTKQTAIAAPAAVFGTHLLLRPRTALTGIATSLTLGIAMLGAAMWLTDGGFLRHIIQYNINRISLDRVLDVLEAWGTHFIYFAAAAWVIVRRLRRLAGERGAAGGWRALKQKLIDSPADASFAMLVAYLGLASLMLVLALKSGASINYFLEWCCLIALFAGLALAEPVSVALGRADVARRGWVLLIVPCAVSIQAIALLCVVDAHYTEKARLRGELSQLTRLIREAPKPVIGDDMVGILRAGKTVQWEPSIFAELASKGEWDERPFVARIMARQFAFFVTEGEPGNDSVYDERYNPAVNRAIQSAYPMKRKLAGYWLHFPAGAFPSSAQVR